MNGPTGRVVSRRTVDRCGMRRATRENIYRAQRAGTLRRWPIRSISATSAQRILSARGRRTQRRGGLNRRSPIFWLEADVWIAERIRKAGLSGQARTSVGWVKPAAERRIARTGPVAEVVTG
jgi:hypothetical protein